MYTNIYRDVYGPCTWPVITAVYWPCTRPCIWRLHGLVTAVYTYACVHGRVTCRVHGRGRVHGRVTCRVPVTRRPKTCSRAVYTAVYMALTRPCNGGVQVGLCVCTRLCTRQRAGRVGPCRRPYTCRVQGRGPCTRLVRSVLLRFSLQKTHLLCRNVQLQIHYI